MSEIAEHIFSITENKCLKDVPRPKSSQQDSSCSNAPASSAVLDRKKSLLTDELQ